ncbi:hypothetical protein K402DRAFT_178704 [Aulographum hederae CBS 113979]|uniref:Mitochondrial protein from FMP27-domain-containing protein n=1 Tax=Aulographum hederae CBS 113979 TaxID=1176131 RepID=A0A6G1GQC7_9PEZI|nr:hypothetical protein K402DRAFT_178704 [Aulographum hederae CBS 113979]
MAFPNPSFALGVCFLIYLATFVVFALLRIITGVSIQRVGYSGFRRIAFTPREGIRIDIRGVGLSLHRPTFAQPTWFSIKLTELKISLDLTKLGKKAARKKSPWTHWRNVSADKLNGYVQGSRPTTPDPDGDYDGDTERTRTWQRLTEMKERIKRLHRKIKWIRMVDLVANNTSLVLADIGTMQMVHFTVAVDTRLKTVDRGRLFHHRRAKDNTKQPAEWIAAARSILFSPEGKESTEILDHCTLNVHGLLHQELDGLRDASIALKLGRLSIPYDDIKTTLDRVKHCRRVYGVKEHVESEAELSFTDIAEELDRPGSREENIVRTVSDSKEFISSILRGIQEFQFAVGFFGLTKRFRDLPSESPVFMNMSMKEVGVDLLRLDPRSPAHLMYFSPTDVAHQALIAAISISVGIDDGHVRPERLLYVPMATATVKTTLPSKTIHFSGDRNVAERNTNILFANLVVTSPSADLDPKHLPLMLAVLHRDKSPSRNSIRKKTGHSLLSRLLPKASVKISIQEPVIRVTLPPMEEQKKGTDEFDLLISVASSVSLDVESSHSAGGDLHYSLASNFRILNHNFYYQTASGERHNLMLADTLETKIQVSASPEVAVIASGNLQTFSVYLVRPEICEGLHQIIVQLRNDRFMSRRSRSQGPKLNFLRRFPPWLQHFNFQGSDFNVEVAGIDPMVSRNSRGVALHLDSWTSEYKSNRNAETEIRPTRRRAASKNLRPEDALPRSRSPSSPPSPQRDQASPTDSRRLAIHSHGLEAYVVESADTWEPEAFLSLPRFEIAFSTSSDTHGPIFHINSYARSLSVNYSLYRHYAVGVAWKVLQKTFSTPSTPSNTPKAPDQSFDAMSEKIADRYSYRTTSEIVAVDVKAGFIQIKAFMPADPALMIHVIGVEVGRHRWATPFAKAKTLSLYAETPNVPKTWSRVVSIKTLRLDYRRIRRKFGNTMVEDNSIDVAIEATRLAVPHQLVLHKIFDNCVNITKTAQQLRHRFQTETDEYILNKQPEGPKRVPKLSLRSQSFLFEIEDGAFEWKLGVIYRTGLLEQKQRSAREAAFSLKEKRLQELDKNQRATSRLRARSAHNTRGRAKRTASDEAIPRSKSMDGKERGRSDDSEKPSPKTRRGKARYDADGICGLSDVAHTSIEKAREKLDRYNAQSWKKRIDHTLAFQNRGIEDIRALFWGADEDLPESNEHNERIMAMPRRPALMAMSIRDLNVLVDKPSFPLHKYPEFLHRMGKGMPRDKQYSLLIPMHLQVSMGEARVSLRDYPLPLLHVPGLRPGQSPRLPSLHLTTDFVIAEEYQDLESARHVNIVVVPPEKSPSGGLEGGMKIDVRRTVSAVKTYSDMAININTGYSTKITWGTSYQPAIQDTMQVVENFTKPAIDPSERVGFWDKIRLTFHSRLQVSWKGDGDVHLLLKGSRDPYAVLGTGAGFVMCWRNDVQWNIWQNEDPKRFMTVRSGTYVLAVPDLSHYARQMGAKDGSNSSSVSSAPSYKQGAVFRKTVMKLSGNVQWLAGLVFERNKPDGGRSFDFRPHYDIVLKNPKFAKSRDDLPYDAFRGFRSHYIHLSVAIAAPVDRDWSVTNVKPSSDYNSVHLTPRFFSHFYSWWSMFSGVMSLPIRQGKLWPGIEKSSKKFGRHLATIKYNLLLSPLYMSHIYKHKDAEEYGRHTVHSTGLKVRLDSFMLDLHQRREEFTTPVQGAKHSKTTGMRINQAQLDFISADIRAISASIMGTDPSDLDNATAEELASYQPHDMSVDLARFTIPDQDFKWVDMDDFVELDWILPAESNPETKILPLAFAPRFTYYRQTDHHDMISGDPNRTSPFGNEDTHNCVMSASNDPRRVQCRLIEDRLDHVQQQIEQNLRAIGEQELAIIRDVNNDESLRTELKVLQAHDGTLKRKQDFLHAMHDSIMMRLQSNDHRAVPDPGAADDQFFEAREGLDSADADGEGVENTNTMADYVSDFNNRFIIHNPQVKWNNSLRNIILRYIHQVSQRRGFVYYMSRRAVKFILDILEEQQRAKTERNNSKGPDISRTESVATPLGDDDVEVQDRIQAIINDGRQFVTADDTGESSAQKPSGHGEEISNDFTPQNAYHLRLIAPQIQLQSEKDKHMVVLVTAKGMQLKVVSIMDKDRVTDDVSGLVQRRFSAAMDSVQMFVTNSRTFAKKYLHMYSGHPYGASVNSLWPPWVPIEAMFDFDMDPYGFQRIVQRTSATLRYDKFNTLRLKYNDDVTTGQADDSSNADNAETRMDHLWIEFPHVRAICNSAQYYALYVIVLDLLLYSEPLEKTRSERLEKIMLASDFSDLRGAPEMVISLQERIHSLQEIKRYFQVDERGLGLHDWKDRITLEQDLTACEDELFFIMKAITTSQRKYDERPSANQSTGLLRWYIQSSEIVWHLIRGVDQSLAEFQLRNAVYDRTDNSDGSNNHIMEIERIQGYNLLPNAVYPEMIAPYLNDDRPFTADKSNKMIRVQWLMLEAIAGIPVMDHFEVNLFPLRIQLEKEAGELVFNYVWPDRNKGDGNQSPFLVKNRLSMTQEVEDEDEDIGDGDSSQDLPTETQSTSSTTVGDLALRLQPTLTLRDTQRPKSSSSKNGDKDPRSTYLGLGHLNVFSSNSQANNRVEALRAFKPTRESSMDSSASSRLRPATNRAASSFTMNASEGRRSSSHDGDRPKRFTIHRSNSKDDVNSKTRSDDLSLMLKRASNYMTLAYVKIPSMVLCLSYKGKGARNIEDVHDLVFRMPTLEYRNKTWSNLDLAIQLKKEVRRALLSHVGTIVGNKFSQHRPTKQQSSRLREIVNSSTLLQKSSDASEATTESNSTRDLSPIGSIRTPEPRPSFTSSRDLGSAPRPGSDCSSLNIPPGHGSGNGNGGMWNNGNGNDNGTAGGGLGLGIRGMSGSESATGNGTPPREDQSSLRRSSLGRRLTGGRGLRASSHSSGGGGKEGADESDGAASRASRLLSGPKRLLHSLPHGGH